MQVSRAELNRGRLSSCVITGAPAMFTLKVSRHFVFEIVNGGIYVKLGRREAFYSREQGLSVD